MNVGSRGGEVVLNGRFLHFGCVFLGRLLNRLLARASCWFISFWDECCGTFIELALLEADVLFIQMYFAGGCHAGCVAKKVGTFMSLCGILERARLHDDLRLELVANWRSIKYL